MNTEGKIRKGEVDINSSQKTNRQTSTIIPKRKKIIVAIRFSQTSPLKVRKPGLRFTPITGKTPSLKMKLNLSTSNHETIYLTIALERIGTPSNAKHCKIARSK